ncbi:MAG: ribonuclease Z [Aureispira sp.]|jgi:ribonuclease Z
MNFELKILGSNAATPAHGRHLSAQVLTIGADVFLIDCGEGTQFQMLKFHVKRNKINHIFISHLHGDHIFGLIGLLMSYDLNGRTNSLHIYSPVGLQAIIDIQFSDQPKFPLHFHVTDPNVSTILFENNRVEVTSIPLVHRVPCHGFLFAEKPYKANILKEKIEAYQIPYQAISAIKDGADYTLEDGTVISHEELTQAPAPPRKFAYCSDTMYSEAILPIIKGVDILYHEATFMQDLLPQAQKTMHSTAQQAASIAKQANVKQLILGHFSSRYDDLNPLLEEAKAVFESTTLVVEGKRILVERETT